MKKMVYRCCLAMVLAGSSAWADSSLDKFGLGSILQYGRLYADDFGCATQYKTLYGVDGGCIDRLFSHAGMFAPFSMDRFLNGMVPIVLVTLTLLLADLRYRRQLTRRRAATAD